MRRGVIGYPMGHSYSKPIHEQLGGYEFEIIELHPDKFDAFLKAKEFDSVNVTIPYKQQIIPYLDELDDKAKRIGAVNTVVNDSGKLKGYNTDYYGFWWMLDDHQIEIKNKKVVILGNGGATKALKVVIQDMGAKQLLIVSRTKTDETITYDELFEKHQDVEVLINATPVGMSPKHDDCPIDLERLEKLESVVDIVYNPLKTKLILQAEKLGCKTVCGLEMLVAQAKQAVEIFTNKQLSDEDIKKVTFDIISKKENLVFIGMPSSGKTTIAKILSEQLELPFIDLDEEIVKKAGKSIKQIFEESGEEIFRDIESECVEDHCMDEGTIISCGGGVIKRNKNIEHLKKKGYLIWIDRDLAYLKSDDNRPLCKDDETMKRLYSERYSLYKDAADIRIENNNTELEVLEKIKNHLESRKIK
ncbi:shikimate kinase [Anaerorhabdus sp.]|uniref:shikimate kinase n=1 Tax=Anaerorhabdus sp. TaxID=1872524 RepID=UPI002FCC1F0F